MTRKSFIKLACFTPLTVLSSETNYGFNFIGNIQPKLRTEFSNKIDRKPSDDVYILLYGNYNNDDVRFCKWAVEINQTTDPNQTIFDKLYEVLTSNTTFLPLSEYHKYPTEFMKKLDKKLKKAKRIVNIYTDFNSFKQMMDIQYRGNYSQEFLEDVKKLNFTT